MFNKILSMYIIYIKRNNLYIISCCYSTLIIDLNDNLFLLYSISVNEFIIKKTEQFIVEIKNLNKY